VESPDHVATMLWLPVVNAEVVNVDVNVPIPTLRGVALGKPLSTVQSTLRLVGLPEKTEGVMVAVNVTLCPRADGLTDDVTTRDVPVVAEAGSAVVNSSPTTVVATTNASPANMGKRSKRRPKVIVTPRFLECAGREPRRRVFLSLSMP
jgi:hypothetical protein